MLQVKLNIIYTCKIWNAVIILDNNNKKVNHSLDKVEKSKLNEIGKNREDYEKLPNYLDKKFSFMP